MKTKKQIRTENENRYFKKYGKTKLKPMSQWEETRTQAEYAEELSLKKIVAKYHKTGYLPTKNGSYFGDISDIQDFTEAQNKIDYAKSRFMELPSTTRREFNNNPAELLDSLNDPTQKSRLQSLGILTKPEPEPATGSATEPTNSGEGGSSAEPSTEG